MGQLCSSDQIQHDHHRTSQNFQRKKTDSPTPIQKSNDHYSQGYIEVPPAPLNADEYGQENPHENRYVIVKTDEFCQQEKDQQLSFAKAQHSDEETKVDFKKREELYLENLEREKMKEKCPICEETYEILYEKPVFAICQHNFCSRCLQETLKIQPYCPICYTYQSENLYNAKGEQIYEVKERATNEPINKALWNLDFVRTVVGDEVKKEARGVFW